MIYRVPNEIKVQLERMQPPSNLKFNIDAFFYCRHLELTYPDTVGFSMVTIKDSL